MNYSCTGSRLFSHVSGEGPVLCTKLCMSYFCSFAGFAVCIDMETGLREIVFLI